MGPEFHLGWMAQQTLKFNYKWKEVFIAMYAMSMRTELKWLEKVSVITEKKPLIKETYIANDT